MQEQIMAEDGVMDFQQITINFNSKAIEQPQKTWKIAQKLHVTFYATFFVN